MTNWMLAALIVASTQLAPRQTSAGTPSPPPATPAYEVATIKPPGPSEYASPLRVRIQSAYGIPVNSTGWVIGPDWINSAKYVIQAKPPDSIRDASKTMTRPERIHAYQQMDRALLAERFKLKAHFETREMPVYELIVAKGGAKLKENPDAIHGQMAVGKSMIRGKAAPIDAFLGMLESVPDIGGRVILDKTGLTGTYDISLNWAPMEATGLNSAPTLDAEAATLFTAIEEQLGLKLLATRAPGQVLVIDHIERPSEN